MSALELELEIAGYKCRVAGDREDVFAALAEMREHVAELASSLPSASDPSDSMSDAGQPKVNGDSRLTSKSSTSKKIRTQRPSSSARVLQEAIDFRHDADRFGFPSEEWNTATKALWLLYVLEFQTDIREASAFVLTETFNKHFKQFGPIKSFNVTRDLGKAKSKNGNVNSDSGKTPEVWFLLASGKKAIESLISKESTNGRSTEAAAD